MYLSPLAALIPCTSTKGPGAFARVVQKGQNSRDAPKIHLKTLCGDCWGEKWRMWEGREADGLLHCESKQLSAGRPAKCSNSPYKWHPARPVSSWTTLIPSLGLNSESQTPTYTVKRKGYFWKMGPTLWFNSLTNPRKRGFSPPGRGRDLEWDYTSVWIFPVSPPYSHTCTHTPMHTVIFLIHHWLI